MLLARVTLGDGESYASLFNRLKSSGYRRVRIDGEIQETARATTLDARRKHRVEVVVDRVTVRAKSRGRIAESIDHAMALGNGAMNLLCEPFETVETDEHGAIIATHKRRKREQLFSQRFACTKCGNSYTELTPHHFSFNSTLGWCETCEGLGVQRGAPEATIIKYPRKTILSGAIAGWSSVSSGSPLGRMLLALCQHIGVDVDLPMTDWQTPHKRILMFGAAAKWIDGSAIAPQLRFQWKGFFPAIDDATRNSWSLRHRLHNVVAEIPCIACRGGRLRQDAAAVRLGKKTIVEVCDVPLAEAARFFDKLKLGATQRRVAGELLKEIRNRLKFLIDVGLDYVSLHRSAPTLSGGESQRIRLAGQIGSGLSGVLYVLDEPTIGLHPRDTGRLIRALRKLRDLGNTLLTVEHDRDVIADADHLLDFGPGAGADGGRLVADGAPRDLARRGSQADQRETPHDSITRKYLSGEEAVPIPSNRRPIQQDGWKSVRADNESSPRRRKQTAPAGPNEFAGWLVVRGARQNNLKNIDVPIPLGRLTCITGVSGSGKSSLVNDILWPALSNRLQRANRTAGQHDGIDGATRLDKVIDVDQAPIGSTPSSNPATYTGAFDWIRELFARLPDSKVRGYNAKRFSFNRAGGRCEACEGYGQKCIEMHFLPDVWIECETCKGRRYNPETLDVKYKGKSIADVLEMSVGDARKLFENVPKVRRMLQTLSDVGLDYVHLGQPAPTLSGGEAQRVKLAAELGKPNTGRTLYILDEPTTGLHFHDVRKLLDVLNRLADLGNTVVVVEHNLDVLKSADWIIDLGPEAGDAGGEIVAMGTPEEIVDPEHQSRRSVCHTATALRPILERGPYRRREVYDAREHAAREIEIEKSRIDVGGDTRMPWQVDGRRWHLEQRTSHQGKPVRWDPLALEFVERLIVEAAEFDAPDWNDRSRIEITVGGAETWFFHCLTGGEWQLDFNFRVPRGTFKSRTLATRLRLGKLDDRDDLPVYSRCQRVHCRRQNARFDAIRIQVHDKAEIDTPQFRKFIKDAARAYRTALAADWDARQKSPAGKRPGSDARLLKQIEQLQGKHAARRTDKPSRGRKSDA